MTRSGKKKTVARRKRPAKKATAKAKKKAAKKPVKKKQAEESDEVQDLELTRGTMAVLLDLSGPRITQIANEGEVFERLPSGGYSPKAAGNYVKWLKTRLRKDEYATQLEAEKVREKKRQNDLAEERLLPVEMFGSLWECVVEAMVSVIEEFPMKWKRLWPETTGDQMEFIKRMTAELRNAIAKAAITAPIKLAKLLPRALTGSSQKGA